MADTGKQSPLGINLLGSLLGNANVFAINSKINNLIGTSTSNEDYTPGNIVTSTCLRLLNLAINDAYIRGASSVSVQDAGTVYTDGSGEKASFDVTKSSGTYTVAINSSGANYSPGDTIVVNAPEVNAPIVPVANVEYGATTIIQAPGGGITITAPTTPGPWPDQTSWPLSRLAGNYVINDVNETTFSVFDPSNGETVFVPKTQIVTFAGYQFQWIDKYGGLVYAGN